MVNSATLTFVIACENCERAIRKILASVELLGVKVMSSIPPLYISLAVPKTLFILPFPPMRKTSDVALLKVVAALLVALLPVSSVPF